MAEKKAGESLGISGLTLGVSGFFVLLLDPFPSIFLFIAGLIFCIIQQKKKKTKFGKIGLMVNVIGLIGNIVYIVILIQYLMPIVEDMYSKYSFPT